MRRSTSASKTLRKAWDAVKEARWVAFIPAIPFLNCCLLFLSCASKIFSRVLRFFFLLKNDLIWIVFSGQRCLNSIWFDWKMWLNYTIDSSCISLSYSRTNRTVNSYKAMSPDELSFTVGETLHIINTRANYDQAKHSWKWVAMRKDGKKIDEGLVPCMGR